jgi:hypothetical protein
MRRLWVALILVGVIGVVALGGRDFWLDTQSFVDTASVAYQRFASDNEGALLMNTTGGSVTGLRVTFSGPVSSVRGEGIGSAVEVSSNEGGVAMFSGEIPASGTVYVEWPLGEAEIAAAEWLQGDAVVGTIDLHAPMAVMSGQSDVGVTFFDMPQAFAQVWATGDLSRSPDGSPIVRYLWEWSDGTSQEGADVSRTFVVELTDELWEARQRESVTLTVWNAAGRSSSVTHTVLLTIAAPPPAT